MSEGRSSAVLRRNNVRIKGTTGRTIVFAHGFGCDQTVWRRVAPAFENDFRTVTFDHVGAGDSSTTAYDPEKYASLDGYVQDLLDMCKALDLRQAVYVGHSVSAMIGLLASIREPDVFESLVLIGPSPRYINDGDYVGGFTPSDMDELFLTLDENFFAWTASMAPVIMNNPERPVLASELANSFCRLDPTIAKQFARVTFLSDCRHQLKLLRVPSLILQCRDDAIAPLEVGHYMHQNMQASVLRIMAAEGHCPHMSAPDETIAAIRSFL